MTSWLTFTAGNLIMWAIYSMKHPFFEQYKIQDDPWPWEEEPEKWRKLFRKTILLLLFTNFLLQPFSLYLTYLCTNSVLFDMRLETIPESWTMFKQIMFCFVIEDTTFYFFHRLLHVKFFMKHVHYIHHQYFVTIGIASEYSHPLETILGNNLPFILGPMLIGKTFHLWTLLCWVYLRIMGTIVGHCGYEFPFQFLGIHLSALLPFSNTSIFHDYHHSHVEGNYGGNFPFWDALFGNDVDYWKYKEL